MSVAEHRFLGIPAAKPRVWIDLSSASSKRAGLAMHSPGRTVLKWAVKIMGWFAWLPIEKILHCPVRRFEELDGHEVVEKVVGTSIEYLTLYMGNDSAKSKLTVLVRVRDERGGMRDVIVKLGKTPEAAEAIRTLGGGPVRIEDGGCGDDGHIFAVVEKTGITPRKYPRKAGLPAKQPLGSR